MNVARADSPVRLDDAMRERISLARMVCVLCMIYVHVPGAVEHVSLQFAHPGVLVQGFLVEGTGRASASLLSLISGYLVARTLLRPGSSPINLYRRRFRSLMLPMMFWSSLTWLVYSLVSQFQPTFLDEARGLLDHLNVVLFLTDTPNGATMHLGFLRDLFVCVLLSPLLLVGLSRAPILLLLAMAVLYLVVHDGSAVIILRPLILFAFSIGMLLALRGAYLRRLDRYRVFWIIGALVAAFLILLSNGGGFPEVDARFADVGLSFREAVLYPLSRLFGSLAVWTCLPFLFGTWLQRVFDKLMPYLFATFCSHYLLLTLVWFGAWQPLFGAEESGLFILWFLVAPALSLLLAYGFVNVVVMLWPSLAVLITGGRLKLNRESESAPGLAGATRVAEAKQRQGLSLLLWQVAQRVLEGASWLFGTLPRECWHAGRRILLGGRDR
ncbi:MAG: hypothetical protein CSB44_11390 [Gammaproteobacteria bacterium]|nr:MAG: hypothetical protein CSB44_11390 [Gammaproteobacteria bacterium]